MSIENPYNDLRKDNYLPIQNITFLLIPLFIVLNRVLQVFFYTLLHEHNDIPIKNVSLFKKK